MNPQYNPQYNPQSGDAISPYQQMPAGGVYGQTCAAPGVQVQPMYAVPLSAAPMIAPRDDFQFELFDCCKDQQLCCDAWFCPYCQLGRQQNMIDIERPTIFNGMCMLAFSVDLLAIVITIVLNVVKPNLWEMEVPAAMGPGAMCYTYYVRQKIRRRYGFRINNLEDVLMSIFCIPCAIVQQNREMDFRGMDPGTSCRPAKPPRGLMS